MRFAAALAAVLALAFPASAQWTDMRLPDRVYTAVPFMVDLSLDCPPPDEAPPPIGCNGTLGVWFEASSDHSAFVPQGFVTLFPFQSTRAGPFTFHKPGLHTLSLFAFSREFIGEIDMVGQVSFLVQPPTAGAARRK